jgi:hypothetical protein
MTAAESLSRILEAFEVSASRIYLARERKWRVYGSVSFQRGALVALLVRQYQLFCYFLKGPMVWDVFLGPTLLRMMIENLITFEWICLDVDHRSALYVDFGLGQARLLGENLRKYVEENGEDETLTSLADAQFEWVERQKLLGFVDINLGSWSDTDLRKMAHETGLDDLYRFGFAVFSSAVHGTWNHTGMLDVRPCQNEGHKHHLLGHAVTYFSEDFLYRACKYFDLFFDSVDRQLGIKRRRRSLMTMFDAGEAKIVTNLRKLLRGQEEPFQAAG